MARGRFQFQQGAGAVCQEGLCLRAEFRGERRGTSLQSTSLQRTDESNKFAPLKPGSLQAIINAYKSSVTRWCRKNGYDNFAWQPRFYDHVIRDEHSLAKIQEYIVNNPDKWDEDQDNPANLWM